MSSLGKFVNVKAAAISFIFDHLEHDSVRVECPRLYKIELEFSLFLQRRSVPELVANDVANKQLDLIWERLRTQIDRWHIQGVIPPYIEDPEAEDTLVTWRHARYQDISGTQPLKINFFEIYNWLATQRDNDFILPCACYLRAVGCDPIFVTDGAGDEGIDCIGIIAFGPLRGTSLLVQAKSSPSPLSADELLQEFGKSIAMRRTRRYREYLDALAVDKSRTGSADLYVLISNGDLKHGGAEAAHKIGALIRSRRQIAHALSERYTLKDLCRFRANPAFPKTSDLTLNVAPMLTPPGTAD